MSERRKLAIIEIANAKKGIIRKMAADSLVVMFHEEKNIINSDLSS